MLEQIVAIDQELLAVILDKKNAGIENQLVYETQKQQLTVSESALAAIIVQVEQAKNMLTFLLGKVPHEVSFSPVKEVPTIGQLRKRVFHQIYCDEDLTLKALKKKQLPHLSNRCSCS